MKMANEVGHTGEYGLDSRQNALAHIMNQSDRIAVLPLDPAQNGMSNAAFSDGSLTLSKPAGQYRQCR